MSSKTSDSSKKTKKTTSNGRTRSSNTSSSASTSKAKAKAEEIQSKNNVKKRVSDEIWAIIIIAIGVFFVVAVFTQGAGKLGEIIGTGLKGLFGFLAYVVPFYLVVFGVLLFAKQTSHFNVKSIVLLFIMLIFVCSLNSIHFVIKSPEFTWSWAAVKLFYSQGITMESGGFFGMVIARALVSWVGRSGCWITGLVVILICILLIINTPISRFFAKIGEKKEEKRLIKEHAHLDEIYESENMHSEQLTMDDLSVKKNDVSAARTDDLNKRNNFAAKSSEKKSKKILSFMKDDTLFGAEEKHTEEKTYGLEEKTPVKSGYGLDSYETEETFSSKNVSSFGLENNQSNRIKTEDDVNMFKTDSFKPDYDNNTLANEPNEPNPEIQNKISRTDAKNAVLREEDLNTAKVAKKYKLPPVSLLEKGKAQESESINVLQARAHLLEDTLRSFNVEAHVVQVTQGSTVTRYEIQPAVGVKVSKIVNLANDIALRLRAKSIRIEAPIPGKAAIGIEIENEISTMVRLRELIDSDEFRSAKSKITFALGKDIAGKVVVANMKDMPHLLIAGSTGSGKSVCINSIISSFLYKANPDEVKLILIDPKVVELGNYNGIPHLLIPVVTEPTKAAAALNWAVSEMDERYNKFAIEGVKDLESYNELCRLNNEHDKVLPQVVIIIDELADLMMAASSQVQDSICRIAQKARAAGMHLIVATQRPSVDVITGVIKANIPSRIAFAVSSHVDSMTILDEKGAEKLVGKGDMLFNPMGASKPIRLQGAYVSDKEVNSVIDFVKSQVEEGGINYQNEIISRIECTDVKSKDNSAEEDELLYDALELVVNAGQASVSMLQRRFRIGYNRAARIVDIMEAKGFVGPQDGSRPRQILITREAFEAIDPSNI